MDVVVLLEPDHPEGRLVDAAQPHFSPLAQGIVRGDGIFESMLYDGSRLRKMDEHLWRLRRSAGITGIEIPDDDHWRQAVQTAMGAWRAEPLDDVLPGEAYVRLFVLRGYPPENPDGYAWVVVSPLPTAVRPSAPIAVSLMDRGFASTHAAEAPWLLLGAKTLSYATNMAALREARRRGTQDVIFVTSDGLVLEAPTASVVMQRGHDLVTTPTEIGVLPGTTQRVLFRAAEQAGWSTVVDRLTPDDLFAADALWLSSSGRLLSQVARLDDHELPTDDAVHEELLGLLAEAS